MLERVYRWCVIVWQDLPPLGKAPFAYLFFGLGLFYLLVALVNWRRITEPRDLPRRAFVSRFIYLRFGNLGYRIFLALLGLATMYLGFLMLIYALDLP